MVEKIKKSPYSCEYYTENEKKVMALENAVEADRLQPINFIGKRYYTKEYIDKANRELSKKLSTERGSGDNEGRLAEWEFTYALGHGETLPGCRASLASEYDDHINGIDVVCKLKSEDSDKPHVFGIDICTTTLPDAVNKKFTRGDHSRGDIPIGCSFIKFYEDDGFVACMKGIPRFIMERVHYLSAIKNISIIFTWKKMVRFRIPLTLTYNLIFYPVYLFSRPLW